MVERWSMICVDSWARFVSERNPSVGKLLTRGVRAFRTRNWYNSHLLLASDLLSPTIFWRGSVFWRGAAAYFTMHVAKWSLLKWCLYSLLDFGGLQRAHLGDQLLPGPRGGCVLVIGYKSITKHSVISAVSILLTIDMAEILSIIRPIALVSN